MKCLDCVSVCPNDALYVGWGRPSLATRARSTPPEHRRLPWREEVVLAIAFTLAFFAFRGLYGLFPFLFSLGLAACLAYAALVGYRLATHENVAVRRFALKRGGRLRAPGWLAAGLLALLLVVWSHTAVVQLLRRLGLGGERAVAAALARGEPPTELRARARMAALRLERAARWGARPQPDLAAPLARLGERLGTAADLAGAELAFRAALAAGGATPQLHFDLGLTLAHRGDLSGAERELRAALALDPGSLPARETLAGILAMAGRFDEAAVEFRAALELRPDDAETRLLLARALAEIGQLEAARDEAERALELDPGMAAAHDLLLALSDRSVR